MGGIVDPRRILRVPTVAVIFALGVGLLITAYTVWDKLALVDVPAVVLNTAGNVANVVALSWPVSLIGRPAVVQEWRVDWGRIGLAGISYFSGFYSDCRCPR